jgi:predicted dehydrogenase
MLAAGAAPMFIPARLLGQHAPSKRITLGCIGMGSQGTRANLRAFLNEDGAKVLAVCDVFASRRESARRLVNTEYKSSDCASVEDFREILARKDIDAVVISTPDHWHVPMSLLALAAGKDVFSEKPTHTIAEGRQLRNAVKQRKAIFQMGLEDRSLVHFHKMIELVRNDAIGRVRHVAVSLPCGIAHPKEAPAPVPAGLNYELFLGPAPFHPYTPNRTAKMHWRMIRDYGTGSLVDWGSHLVDTAQLAANDPAVCPVDVKGTGVIPQGAESDVPVSFDLHYRYANGVTMAVKSGDSPDGDGRSASIRIEGTTGWIERTPWSGPLRAHDDSILHTKYAPGISKFWPLPKSEQRNFLDCVKSRAPTTYTEDTMHLLHVTLHLGLIAITLGRPLRWDPSKEQFIDDAEANALQTRPRRNDWMKQ